MRKVRKEVKVIGVVALLVLMGMMIGLLQTYSIKGEVIAVRGDLVTVRDVAGYEWKVFAEDVEVGEEVVLKMNDKGTTSRQDDDVKGLTK